MPEANGTLRQLWLSYHSGVMSTSFMNRWLEYADHYERHLPRRGTGRGVRLLEIGVQSGGSVQMWRDWFGAGALHYVGVDVQVDLLSATLEHLSRAYPVQATVCPRPHRSPLQY